MTTSDPDCLCGNCCFVCSESALNEPRDLDQRLDLPFDHPDCILPAGECPKCGALSYVIDDREGPTYLVVFNQPIEKPDDENGDRLYIAANSIEEAVGYALIANPTLTYNDIVDHMEV